MKLNEVLRALPLDDIESYCDAEGKPLDIPPVGGDTLTLFIVKDLFDGWDPNGNTLQQLNQVRQRINEAQGDLARVELVIEDVIEAVNLTKKLQWLTGDQVADLLEGALSVDLGHWHRWHLLAGIGEQYSLDKEDVEGNLFKVACAIVHGVIESPMEQVPWGSSSPYEPVNWRYFVVNGGKYGYFVCRTHCSGRLETIVGQPTFEECYCCDTLQGANEWLDRNRITLLPCNYIDVHLNSLIGTPFTGDGRGV